MKLGAWPRRKPRKFNCGQHGWLTAAQISKVAGVSLAAVYYRLKHLRHGSGLCAHSLRRRPDRMARSWRSDAPGIGSAVEVAVRIVTAFPHRPPAPAWLMNTFGMSRATAYRWIAAINAATGRS